MFWDTQCPVKRFTENHRGPAARGLASAARRLGCTHQTIVNRMRRYPDVA
jgi:hypothetical protein